MADKTPAMNGAERAAVLLLTLGEQSATEVLRHLGPGEVQALGSAMAGMKQISREQVEAVVSDLHKNLESLSGVNGGNEDYIRRLLVNALGEERAGALVDRILLGRSAKGMETLKWMEPRAIAEMIGQEHPQIIAIVLAHLDPDQAAEVLAGLPPRVRPDVVMRIATLDGVQPHALNELDEVMERQFSGNGGKFKSARLGGHKAAANILNNMESARETELMEQVKKVDEALGQRIEELMFVFDDLAKLDDRSMQALLREVPSERLVVALKGAEPAMMDKVMANLSKRAGEMLKDDLEVKGPVKLSEVDGAQKEILVLARKLADAGTINLGASGEEYV